MSSLVLTPYISRSEIQLAKKLSLVSPPLLNIESYSGLFKINEEFNSKLFFWFFPSKQNRSKAPLILWLNGLGTPSTYGIFTQSGPYKVQNGLLIEREEAWTNFYNVVYIDNPLGTGFSHTDCKEGLSKNFKEVGKNLFKGLQQFYQLFPEYTTNDFYISGVSFAGKYLPALTDEILNCDNKINLKGILLGNPLVDPLTQWRWGEYLYQLGIINDEALKMFLNEENKLQKLIKAGKNIEALEIWTNLMRLEKSYFSDLTEFPHFYHYVDFKEHSTEWLDFLKRPEIKQSLHVGDLELLDGQEALQEQKHDIANSTKSSLEALLDRSVRVLFYNGQFDVICGYPMMATMVRSLQWSGQNSFQLAPRKPWWDAQELLGYVQKFNNLTEIMVRGSGHMVSQENPRRTLQMLRKFINEEF